MKLFFKILPIFISLSTFSQTIIYDEKGIAEVTIEAPNHTIDQSYSEILAFMSEYYIMTKVVSEDAVNKTITIEAQIFDVFNRVIFPKRKTYISEEYFLTFYALNNAIKMRFEHQRFNINLEAIHLSLSDVMNNKSNPQLYKEDKEAYIKSMSSIPISLDYYIKNKEIRY